MAKGKKTGGRKKGTPNRTTAEMREMLKAIAEDEIEALPDLLSQLKPADRVNAIVRLIAYIMPKPPESNSAIDPKQLVIIKDQVNISPIEWISGDPTAKLDQVDSEQEIGA